MSFPNVLSEIQVYVLSGSDTRLLNTDVNLEVSVVLEENRKWVVKLKVQLRDLLF